MHSSSYNELLMRIQDSIDKKTGFLPLDILLNILEIHSDEDFKSFLKKTAISGLTINWDIRTVTFENKSAIEQLINMHTMKTRNQFLDINSPDEYIIWAKNLLNNETDFNPLITPTTNNENHYDIGYFSKGSKIPIIVLLSYYIVPIIILYTFFIFFDLFHISTFLIKILAILYILSLLPVIIILALYASNSRYHNTIILFRTLKSHNTSFTAENLIDEQQQLVHDNSRLRKLVIDTFIVFYVCETENLAQNLMKKPQFREGVQKPLGLLGLIPIVIDIETHKAHIPKLPRTLGYDLQIKVIHKFI